MFVPPSCFRWESNYLKGEEPVRELLAELESSLCIHICLWRFFADEHSLWIGRDVGNSVRGVIGVLRMGRSLGFAVFVLCF